MTREFVKIEIFENYILNYGELLGDRVISKLYMGFDYLNVSSKEDFISDYNEDMCALESPPLSEVARALFEDLIQHFCCELALTLLEETDVDEYLDSSIKLSRLSPQFVAFKCRG